MKKIICMICLISVCLCSYSVVLKAQKIEEIDPYSLYSKAAVLMDADAKRVLYSKNGDEVLPMASTTKIMTCILALEYGDLEDAVEISPYATTQPKVKLFLGVADQIKLGDLLYSLMLESHNDTAVAIAEYIGTKILQDHELPETTKRSYEESKIAVKAFATRMNEKAIELGCENTYYITPNGLDATETFIKDDGNEIVKIHSTSAKDLATIMSYCILDSKKSQEFRQITSTIQYSFSTLDGTRSFSCNNHNAFLNMMDGAISGKTGYTGNASYCYVGALEREGNTYVVALLSCGTYGNQTKKWVDTKKLMTYGIDHYDKREVYNGTRLENVLVENATMEEVGYFEECTTTLQVVDDTPISLLVSNQDKIDVVVEHPSKLQAPVDDGSVVGSVIIYINDQEYERRTVITTQSIDKKTIVNALEYTIYRFLCKII